MGGKLYKHNMRKTNLTGNQNVRPSVSDENKCSALQRPAAISFIGSSHVVDGSF